MTEENLTSTWENVKNRANYIATTTVPFNELGLNYIKALVEEIDRLHTRIDQLIVKE